MEEVYRVLKRCVMGFVGCGRGVEGILGVLEVCRQWVVMS